MTTKDVSATLMAKENRTARKRSLFFKRVVKMMIAVSKRLIFTSTCMLKRSIHKLTMFSQVFSSIPNSVHLTTMIGIALFAESKHS